MEKNKDWIDFCDGLYHLYYGNNELYLNAMKKLLDSEIRKYDHILHKQIALFKNGEKVQLTYWYDDSERNELEETNEYLIIPSFLINFQNTYEIIKEDFIKKYKVPKTEIIEIKEIVELVKI